LYSALLLDQLFDFHPSGH